jgi:hypothetical protein
MNRRSCRGDDPNEVHCLTARCAGASVRQPAGVTTQTRRAAGMLRQAHVSGDVADGFLSISSRYALFQGQARVSGDVAMEQTDVAALAFRAMPLPRGADPINRSCRFICRICYHFPLRVMPG